MKTQQQLEYLIRLLGGRSPKEVFYEECNKRGVNPELILSKLR